MAPRWLSNRQESAFSVKAATFMNSSGHFIAGSSFFRCMIPEFHIDRPVTVKRLWGNKKDYTASSGKLAGNQLVKLLGRYKSCFVNVSNPYERVEFRWTKKGRGRGGGEGESNCSRLSLTVNRIFHFVVMKINDSEFNNWNFCAFPRGRWIWFLWFRWLIDLDEKSFYLFRMGSK